MRIDEVKKRMAKGVYITLSGYFADLRRKNKGRT